MSLLAALTSQPRTKRDLAESLGTTTREIELAIRALRLEGQPILSNGDGYWMARDAAELAQCVARLRRRAVEQLLTVRAMRATLRRLEASEAAPLAFAWREAA